MCIECAGYACEECTEEECHHFVVNDIDACQGCCVFIRFDSCHRAAHAGVFQSVPEGDDGDDDEEKDDAHQELAACLGVHFQSIEKAPVAGIVRKRGCHGRNAGETKRAVRDGQV